MVIEQLSKPDFSNFINYTIQYWELIDKFNKKNESFEEEDVETFLGVCALLIEFARLDREVQPAVIRMFTGVIDETERPSSSNALTEEQKRQQEIFQAWFETEISLALLVENAHTFKEALRKLKVSADRPIMKILQNRKRTTHAKLAS
ncbi:MAG TPA: hypothetical protein VD999_04290 [Vitreimonas sp.]|nr:hypothetical protein [Vitreimonas sp.]